MPRSVAVAAVVAILAATLSGVPAGAGPVVERYHRSALTATNHERAERDRVELRRGGCLQRLAVHHAKRLAADLELRHQDLQVVLDTCGLTLAGENLAAGFATGRKAVRRGWMKSKPHRHNLLDRRFRTVGIAARRGADERWYVVQLLGRHAD